MFVHMYMFVYESDTAFAWKSEDNLLESVFSSHHEALGLGDQTHVIRLSGNIVIYPRCD